MNDTGKEVIITILGIIGAAILAIVVKKLVSWIMYIVEDAVKLNPDYEEIIKEYHNSLDKFLHIKNENDLRMWKKRLKSFSYCDEQGCYILPEEFIIIKHKEKSFEVEIVDDKYKWNKLPFEIIAHSDGNIAAHSKCRIHNNINIRVDACENNQNGNGIKIFTSRTTYFDSLATNRAMDYAWNNGITLRKMITYNKRIASLDKMSLSNHLRINGVIKTADNNIVCIYRSKEASIGKRTYSISVGAAIEDYQSVDGTGVFTKEGLENAIYCMVKKEVGILKSEYDFNMEENIIAFYREWVEGGKPKFLFYIDCVLTEEEIKKCFKDKDRDKSAVNYDIKFIGI